MPSKNSQDSLENSELLPIGKKTVDAALVPICLNTEDVNNKIAKLKLSNKEITSQSTSAGVTTTTIVMNANGMVESTTTNTTLKSPLSSPMPKSAPSDDSPDLP